MPQSDAPLPVSVLTALDEKLNAFADAVAKEAREARHRTEAAMCELYDAKQSARAALLHSLREMAADTARLDWLADKVLRVSSSDDDEWEFALFSDAEHPEERIITAGPTFREALDAARTPQPETRP